MKYYYNIITDVFGSTYGYLFIDYKGQVEFTHSTVLKNHKYNIFSLSLARVFKKQAQISFTDHKGIIKPYYVKNNKRT